MKVAKSRVYLASDGKTLVEEGNEKANELFANQGQRLPEHRLEKVSNADKFFADEKEGKEPAKESVKTHTAPAGHTRVEPEPAAPHSKAAAHVRK